MDSEVIVVGAGPRIGCAPVSKGLVERVLILDAGQIGTLFVVGRSRCA